MISKILLSVWLVCMSGLSYAESNTWYFVRHFEKQSGHNPSLTEQGKARAVALAAYFKDISLNSVYSTNYNRTQETAAPVADVKGLTVKNYAPSDLAGFAKTLKKLNNTIVVGHSNTTPDLLALMGGPRITIKESEYGTLYKIHSNSSGDIFSAVQILLE